MMRFLFCMTILLTACNQKEDETARKTQAIEDMHTKVQSVVNQLRADCDSNLYQLARQKADSIRGAKKRLRR